MYENAEKGYVMIKLCGIRRGEDVSYVNEFLPDYIGMILAEGFRRTVDIQTARTITRALDSRIKKVGVFVDTPVDRVRQAADILSLDVIQLHGHEDRSYIEKVRSIGIPVWKAVRVKSREDIRSAEVLDCDMLLLDSFVSGKVGGTGTVSDWELIRSTRIDIPFFLAGGISEENLKDALTVSPNIDISGGIETNGVKDREKIRRIMNIYKGAVS